MEKVRVLHSITGLEGEGAQYMLLRYLGGLRDSAWSSSVLSLLAPGLLGQRVTDLSADLLSLGMTEGNVGPANLVKLAKIVRQTNPDILHGWMYHGNVAASVGTMLSLRFAPVVWSVHHSLHDMSLEKPLTRWLVRLSALLSSRTSAISYCSQISADQHEKLGFDPEKTVVIPNGIDCEEFQPVEDAKPKLLGLLSLPPERSIIGHFARFHPMKDQVRLVRAVKELLDEGYDVQGLFVGAGHVDGAVRQAAGELGIDSRISTLGVRDDVANLMPGLDVYALPSAWGEAFPLAVAEAMASGIPAVVTDVGDCSWLVGDTGAIVPASDTDALVVALKGMLDLGEQGRRELGLRARQRVIENFSLQQYVERHIALYEKALAYTRHSSRD